MGKSIIKDKSFLFAKRIVMLFKYLIDDKKEFVLSKQLLRSGTAVGALVRSGNVLLVLSYNSASKLKSFVHRLGLLASCHPSN